MSEEISFKSNWGTGNQDISLFRPSDEKVGKHPCLIVANGSGEVGTKNSAVGSVGAQCRAGAAMVFFNAFYGHNSSFYVIEVHKPYGGVGNFEPGRFKDAYDWAVANLQYIDLSQIYATGLSLSGGGLWSLMTSPYAAKFAAVAPICGVGDADWHAVFDNVLKCALPFTTVDCADDTNLQTHAAFDMYQMGRNIGYSATLPDSADVRFIRPLTGDHAGSWIKGYDMGNISFPIQGNAGYANKPNLFEWFLTKARAGVVPVPAPVPTPAPGPTPAPAPDPDTVVDETFLITKYKSGRRELK